MADDRLMTTGDIGDRLGVTAERARQLSHTDGFPDPKQKIGNIRVWSADAVEAWVSANRPDPADG